jgi:hypothetical protein
MAYKHTRFSSFEMNHFAGNCVPTGLWNVKDNTKYKNVLAIKECSTAYIVFKQMYGLQPNRKIGEYPV